MQKLNYLFSSILCVFSVLVFGACSSEPTPDEMAAKMASAMDLHPQVSLVPTGTLLNPNSPPVVRGVTQGGPAQRSGIRPDDIILGLNGKAIETIADYDVMTKFAPRNSILTVKRNGLRKSIPVVLDNTRSRVGLEIEPMGIPVIRASSPRVSTIHHADMTVHAEASVNKSLNELHVNFIVESHKLLPTALAKVTVVSIKDKKTLLNSRQYLDALGERPLFLAKKVFTHGAVESPIRVSLNISNNYFVFEFQ